MATSEFVRNGVRAYRRAGRRRMLWFAVLLLALFLISVYSLCISRLDITFQQALEAVWNHTFGTAPDRSTDYIAWWIDRNVVDNGARAVCGICVGAVLAVCGAVMQTVTRNPLTDPYTIGISSAALLGVTISIVSGVCIVPFVDGDAAAMANAFVFAMIPAVAIVAVSSFRRLSPTMMILIGIAMMYMFNAVTTFLKFNADPEDLEEIYRWGLGTLTDTDWGSAMVLVPCLLVLVAVFMLIADRLDVLGTGDRVASSLGENPVRVRLVCFVIISAATAVAVCYTGTIGFVGLVAPHVARLFVGSRGRILIPASALVGAITVVCADIIVRSIPQDLPVGVVTALIGSPLFLYFLYLQRRSSAFRARCIIRGTRWMHNPMTDRWYPCAWSTYR